MKVIAKAIKKPVAALVWIKNKLILTAAWVNKAIDLVEVFYLAGLGLVTFGVWKMHQPSAWIVCGVILIFTSFFKAYQEVNNNGISD